MMEENLTDGAKKFRENVFTSSVKAGKRTYYFDVKETKNGEKYITVTERKRRYKDDGSYKVEKHKIFLYKEDFDKFADALDDVIEYVESGKFPENYQENLHKHEDDDDEHDHDHDHDHDDLKENFTDVNFEDLED
jgi:hypothetical protein